MQSASSTVTRVQLLREGDQSPDRSSDSEDEKQVYLQVLPEEESGLAAAAVLLQLQHGVEGADRTQY